MLFKKTLLYVYSVKNNFQPLHRNSFFFKYLSVKVEGDQTRCPKKWGDASPRPPPAGGCATGSITHVHEIITTKMTPMLLIT